MKSSKAAADYRNEANGSERCEGCTMFRAPAGCTAVAGEISPDGWCRFYEAKGRAAVAQAMSPGYDP